MSFAMRIVPGKILKNGFGSLLKCHMSFVSACKKCLGYVDVFNLEDLTAFEQNTRVSEEWGELSAWDLKAVVSFD